MGKKQTEAPTSETAAEAAAAPAPAPAAAPLPTQGGAYVRLPDGTLQRMDDESTALPGTAELNPVQE
jgi:hypothetical protein